MSERLRQIVHRMADELIEAAREEFSSHHKGRAWEESFRASCISQNLCVTKQKDGRHDMEVNGRTVQCKCIDENTGGYVSIDNMRPVKSNGGERGYRIGEYDVMALRSSGKTYLIPASELQDPSRQGFLKSRIRIGDYKHFINAWCVFAGECPQPKGTLF